MKPLSPCPHGFFDCAICHGVTYREVGSRLVEERDADLVAEGVVGPRTRAFLWKSSLLDLLDLPHRRRPR